MCVDGNVYTVTVQLVVSLYPQQSNTVIGKEVVAVERNVASTNRSS